MELYWMGIKGCSFSTRAGFDVNLIPRSIIGKALTTVNRLYLIDEF
jgi:hypothetical protein